MAKKSAKSKGYRKTVEKKPYLSKRDIIILCVLIAVVAVGAILLFNYDDGALKTRGGKIVDAGDNWLIVNGAKSNGRRYFKLAELGEYEGYTRESLPASVDENLSQFEYKADDEDNAVRSFVVSCSGVASQRLATYYASMVASLEPSDIVETELAQGTANYFACNRAYHADEEAGDAEATDGDAETPAGEDEAPAGEDEAPAGDAEAPAGDAEAPAGDAEAPAGEDEDAEPEPNRFEQSLYVCVDAVHDSSVSVSLVRRAESEDDYLSPEELLAFATRFLDEAVTFEVEAPAK